MIGLNFKELNSWLAFNYRIATFDVNYLVIAFEIVKNCANVTYGDRVFKIENDMAVFVCLDQKNDNELISAKPRSEILKEIYRKTTVYNS